MFIYLVVANAAVVGQCALITTETQTNVDTDATTLAQNTGSGFQG